MCKIAVENRVLSVYVVNDKDNEMLILEISKSGTKDNKIWSIIGNRKKLTPKRASKAKDSLSENSGPHNINKKPNNQYIPLVYDFSEDEPNLVIMLR